MRAASFSPTPGRTVSCCAVAVLMLTLPDGAGLAAATARPLEATRAKTRARPVATMRWNFMRSPSFIREGRGRGPAAPQVKRHQNDWRVDAVRDGLADLASNAPHLLSKCRRGPDSPFGTRAGPPHTRRDKGNGGARGERIAKSVAGQRVDARRADGKAGWCLTTRVVSGGRSPTQARPGPAATARQPALTPVRAG